MGSRRAALSDLYQRIPEIECKGYCHTSCGPIAMSPLEWSILTTTAGREPGVTPDLDCDFLTPDGRCEFYAARPAICRMWGVVESMPCVYGCTPERILSDVEAAEILSQIAALSGDRYGDNSRWSTENERRPPVILKGRSNDH